MISFSPPFNARHREIRRSSVRRTPSGTISSPSSSWRVSKIVTARDAIDFEQIFNPRPYLLEGI